MFSDRFMQILQSNFIIVSISISIKNIKNKYTQYSQLPKNKKNKFYVVKTTQSIKNKVYNLIVIKNKGSSEICK